MRPNMVPTAGPLFVLRPFFLLAMALVLTVARPLRAETPLTVENRYHLVSVFLYNFLMFTEWPEDKATDGFVIGVLGPDPFGRAAEAISQKTVDGRSISFRYFNRVDEIVPVHILFIPRAMDSDGLAAVGRVIGTGVLTVGEGELFTRHGGIIRFFEQRSGNDGASVLRIEINEEAAGQEGIKFRSKLMRLAQLVKYPLPAAQ